MQDLYKKIQKEVKHRVAINDVRSLVLGALVCFIIINALFSFFTARLDLSSGHAYTLSSSTRKILKNLDGKVTVKVFISSDLPLRLLPLKTDVENLLGEYRRFSRGKFFVQIVDPAKDTAAQKEVQSLQIPQLQFSQIEKDKYAVSASYFGIALSKEGKTEIIPQAVNVGSLEYDLSAALYKLTSKQTAAIGIVDNPLVVNPQQDQHFSLKSLIQQQYSLAPINVATDAAHMNLDPSSYRSVVVFDSGEPVSAAAIASLTNYLDNGGSLIFITDGVSVDSQLGTHLANHNLSNLFSHYGIMLNRDLVLSQSAEVANFTTGRMSFFTPYAFWVKTANFDKSRSEFSNAGSLLFPWVSSVTIDKKTNAKVLVQSQKNSWNQKDKFTLLPNTITEPSKNAVKEFPLIAEATSKTGGKLLVIPSSRFADEQFVERRSDNIEFILNMLNTYASGGALSGIRARSLTIIPLKEVGESAKEPIKYFNILFLPGLFGLFGLHRIHRRTNES